MSVLSVLRIFNPPEMTDSQRFLQQVEKIIDLRVSGQDVSDEHKKVMVQQLYATIYNKNSGRLSYCLADAESLYATEGRKVSKPIDKRLSDEIAERLHNGWS